MPDPSVVRVRPGADLMTTATPNPTAWIHFILACAVPTEGAPDGICGEFIESEPCPAHGTEA